MGGRRAFYERLLRSGLALLRPADQIPRDPDTGDYITAGFFGVPKRGKTELRLIFDRRPMNAISRRLRWATLPQPSQLRFLLLRRGVRLLADGDDPSVYFYSLRHEGEWVPYNAVGEPVHGAWLLRHGAAT